MRLWTFLCLLLVLPPTGQAACSQDSPEDFAEFLPAFLTSGDFALRRTALPLRSVRWEYGVDAKGRDRTYKTVSLIPKRQIPHDKALSAFMGENEMTHQVFKREREKVEVQIFKPDTDWLLHYHFRRRQGCWQLWQIEDYSL